MDAPAEQPPGAGPLFRHVRAASAGLRQLKTGIRRPGPQQLRAVLRQLGTGLGRLAAEIFTLIRMHPVEALAAVLMGLGGAVFPPVWLLGAGVAVASRTWDLRDKWIGLAGPFLLVIAGTVLVVVIGGHRASFGAYTSEVWLSIGRIARIAAVLGAIFLIWRLRRGPRPTRLPPWNQPHRLG